MVILLASLTVRAVNRILSSLKSFIPSRRGGILSKFNNNSHSLERIFEFVE